METREDRSVHAADAYRLADRVRCHFFHLRRVRRERSHLYAADQQADQHDDRDNSDAARTPGALSRLAREPLTVGFLAIEVVLLGPLLGKRVVPSALFRLTAIALALLALLFRALLAILLLFAAALFFVLLPAHRFLTRALLGITSCALGRVGELAR